MKFQESVEYLLSLGNEVTAMKLGLENIRMLLDALGRPQDNYLKVPVAGTHGQGSVCAFLNSICLTAGVRTGMFTSPHLVCVTERVQINGNDIGEEGFARFATRVRETSEQLVDEKKIENTPTYFEQVTAIALLAFAEAKIELAILETGLGGRLDASTAANAEIAAITRIDIDHQQYLGETIEEIAAEKAAIIHEGSKVVVGEQDDRAMKVIIERCREVGVQPMFALAEVSEVAATEGGNPTGREGVVTAPKRGGEERPSPPVGFPPGSLGLLGHHQIENARIAVLLTELLNKPFSITPQDVALGLKSARHPGRLEWIGRFLLDGAHNVGGAMALQKFLNEFVQKPIAMIFGSMSDKDTAEILSILAPGMSLLMLTRPDNPRARSPIELKNDLPEEVKRGDVVLTKDIAEALDEAVLRMPEGVVLVTGSLYLVGEARRLLKTQI